MTNEEIDKAILASLKKLGPSSPRVLANDAGIATADIRKAGERLRRLGLIKVAGATTQRMWALPDQKLDGAAPPQRKKKPRKSAARKGRKLGRPPGLPSKASKPAADQRANGFLAALTGKKELVLIEDGRHTVITRERTLAIVDLVLANFEP